MVNANESIQVWESDCKPILQLLYEPSRAMFAPSTNCNYKEAPVALSLKGPQNEDSQNLQKINKFSAISQLILQSTALASEEIPARSAFFPIRVVSRFGDVENEATLEYLGMIGHLGPATKVKA